MKKIAIILILILSLGMMIQSQTRVDTLALTGQTVTITATPNPGFRFLHWEDDTTNTNPVRTVLVTADFAPDTTYIAVFEPIEETQVQHRYTESHSRGASR